MNTRDVKPIGSISNFHVDEDIGKGITWNFALAPEGDSKISVTTGNPQPVTVSASDVKDVVKTQDAASAAARVVALIKRAQPAIPKQVLEQAEPHVAQWVSTNWRLFQWLHHGTR